MKTTFYYHPDGFHISFSAMESILHITDGEKEIDIPIGPVGLHNLAVKLASIGIEKGEIA